MYVNFFCEEDNSNPTYCWCTRASGSAGGSDIWQRRALRLDACILKVRTASPLVITLFYLTALSLSFDLHSYQHLYLRFAMLLSKCCWKLWSGPSGVGCRCFRFPAQYSNHTFVARRSRGHNMAMSLEKSAEPEGLCC